MAHHLHHAPSMDVAPKIGIATDSTSNAGAVVQAMAGPNADDASGGKACSWRSVLQAEGLRSQVSAPGAAAGGEPSSGYGPPAASDLHRTTVQFVSADQFGFEGVAGKLSARRGSPQGTRTAVAVSLPKAVDQSASIGISSLRGRKLRRDCDALEKGKKESASGTGTSAAPSVHVLPVPPESSGPAPAPAPANTVNVRGHHAITMPQPSRQDARHDGSAIDASSAGVRESQEDLDSSPAHAESRAPEKSASPEARIEPLPPQRLSENDPMPDTRSQPGAKGSKHPGAEIEQLSFANPHASRQAAATGDSASPGWRGDSFTKAPASASIPERITKSPSKPLTDRIDFGKHDESSQVVPVFTQVMRESGESTSFAERPINAAHNSGRDAIDPFATLDAERAAPAPTWIHAGAHHAEAGYLDPALGWIGVRADSIANSVHASLVPSSGEAAQVLGTHLAGLNSYLSEHHGGLITIDAPQDGRSGTEARQGDHPSSQHERSEPREEPAIPDTRVLRQAAVTASSSSPARALAGGGRYISVLA